MPKGPHTRPCVLLTNRHQQRCHWVIQLRNWDRIPGAQEHNIYKTQTMTTTSSINIHYVVIVLTCCLLFFTDEFGREILVPVARVVTNTAMCRSNKKSVCVLGGGLRLFPKEMGNYLPNDYLTWQSLVTDINIIFKIKINNPNPNIPFLINTEPTLRQPIPQPFRKWLQFSQKY